MKKLSCIILDDEPLGREIIEHFSSKISFLDVKKSFEDPIEAMLFLQEHTIDLLITDINMPQINGIELVQSLRHPPAIIFVTAHRDFALDGFDSGAIDYLVKPVRFERFLTAVNRVKERQKEVYDTETVVRDFIFVKANGKLEKIIFNEIIYIEAQGDYLKIVTKNEHFVTLSTMKSFEEHLLIPEFLRVQRSFIVNVSAIQSFSGHTIELDNGKSISISVSKKEELFKILGV
ncbi:response regulator transcription factor [Empedobacter brevis]|uniref:Response regulator transcription factor n=1 Tax=Empedobacter brevis TaxID=247 RepID=A0AAJ1QDM2_9FLAO|nr:LytTR family DNA-binding domain-containing protein [Empedobacter brevis]MDM1072061.1 response regulator transcription factor [Empedobacter brevis]QHC86334.1 LytTR family transcriptional regulator [Empedobacter brevis]